MKSGGLSCMICIGSDLMPKIQDFMVYHEIWQISWYTMKSGRFHEILVDFMAMTYTMYICIGSDEKYSIQGYTMKSGRFHGEIWISCMESGGFHGHEISDFMKSADFMPRTLVLMKNTAFSGRPYCISVLVLKNPAKSTIHEIWQISW